jgi:hypothetical protein
MNQRIKVDVLVSILVMGEAAVWICGWLPHSPRLLAFVRFVVVRLEVLASWAPLNQRYDG